MNLHYVLFVDSLRRAITGTLPIALVEEGTDEILAVIRIRISRNADPDSGSGSRPCSAVKYKIKEVRFFSFFYVFEL